VIAFQPASGLAALRTVVFDGRFLKPTVFAALFTFGAFLSMKLLVTGEGHTDPGEKLHPIEFLPSVKDTPVQARPPRTPPKPPPKAPPPPRVQVTTPQQELPPTPIQMPRLDLPAMGDGLAIGPGTAHSASTYGELTPMIKVTPRYPRDALRDGISGWVEFEIVVNPDGTVKSARVLRAQPRGVFDVAAMQSVLKWKFRPKIVDGKPQETKGTQKIEFNLEDEK
jgi:protein TonB